MQEASSHSASPILRAGLMLAAAILLVIWGATLIPLVTSWNDPRADGFELIPLFWASITLLPLGVSAFAGALSGREKGVRRARLHLGIAAALLGLVVLLEAFRRLTILIEG